MSRRMKGGLLAGCGVALLVGFGTILRLRLGVTQDVPTPKLFALGYKDGHELAGFSGRPMLLVFGDSRNPSWDAFLLECEKDPELNSLLSEKFQGVLVDSATDREANAVYGGQSIGTVLVKDLHGPIRGVLREPYTCTDVRQILNDSIPYITIEKSPAYTRLLSGTDLIDELVQKEESAEVARLLTLMKHFEAGTKAHADAAAKASALGIVLPPE